MLCIILHKDFMYDEIEIIDELTNMFYEFKVYLNDELDYLNGERLINVELGCFAKLLFENFEN